MHGWAAKTKYRRKFLTETYHWESDKDSRVVGVDLISLARNKERNSEPTDSK